MAKKTSPPRSLIVTRVHAGMAMLDEHCPDWVQRITNLTDFDINSCSKCALGQVYHSYYRGEDELKLTRESAVAVGFMPENDDGQEMEDEVTAMNEVWLEEITNRKESDES